MLKYLAKTFAELATPLSRKKLLLLVEVTEPGLANQIDFYPAVLRGLRLDNSSGDVLDSLSRGYLVAETEISPNNRDMGLEVIDYFRQARLRSIIKVYLFADGQLVEYSHDGRTSVHDLVAGLPSRCRRHEPAAEC